MIKSDKVFSAFLLGLLLCGSAFIYAASYTVQDGPYTVTVSDQPASSVPPVVTPPPVVASASCNTPPLDTSPLTNSVSALAASNIATNYTVNRGQAHSYSWTTGASGKGSIYIDLPTVGGTNTVKYLTISAQTCDFNYATITTNCGSSGSSGSVYYAVGTPVAGSCTLTPNTLYYVNVRNENTAISSRTGNKRGIDSCPAGATCNFLMVRY